MSDKVKLRVDLSGKEDVANKVTSISSASTNTHYPTAKAVYDAISEASGGGSYIIDYYSNPSTNEIILEYTNGGGGGSGGGSSVDIVTEWEQTTSDEKVPSEKLVKTSLDGKSDTGHTHSQYLTEHQSLSNYIQKSGTSGLVKSDGTVDTTSYSTFNGDYSSLTNKPSYTPTVTSSTSGAYKLGSINISGSSVDIYGKDTDTQPPSASTTVPSADANTGSYGSGTTYARSNHTHPKSSIYAEASHTHTSSQVTDLSIPTASSSVPGADTNAGSYGSGTSYARSNHSHPKSSLYAEANHNHTGTYANASHTHSYTELNNVTTVEVTVTYTDNSTETIKLLKYTGT